MPVEEACETAAPVKWNRQALPSHIDWNQCHCPATKAVAKDTVLTASQAVSQAEYQETRAGSPRQGCSDYTTAEGTAPHPEVQEVARHTSPALWLLPEGFWPDATWKGDRHAHTSGRSRRQPEVRARPRWGLSVVPEQAKRVSVAEQGTGLAPGSGSVFGMLARSMPHTARSTPHTSLIPWQNLQPCPWSPEATLRSPHLRSSPARSLSTKEPM